MTDFQSFSNFLAGLNADTILCDKAYAMAFDTGDDTEEQRVRFEIPRYEAMQRGLPIETFNEWVEAMAVKCAEGGHEFIEEALTEGAFGDLVDIVDKVDKGEFPTFPVKALPQNLSRYIEAVSESLQVPVDMPAVATLATLALCVQRTFAISPKPGWVEPMNLYCAIVAAPSERKSPVIKEIAAPVHRFTREENTRRAPAIRDYERKRKILSTRVENMTKQAASGKGGVEVEEVLEVQRELDELEPVRPLRLLADDTTPEALTKLLAANGGKMCIMSTEGGLFTILSGLYTSKSANVDTFLKAYSGDFIQVDRLGRESETIENPALTMLLMIQPQVLHEIMQNEEFKGRGLLARFLYALPSSVIGGRGYRTAPIPCELKEQFHSLVNALLSIPSGENPRVIYLNDDASDLAEDYFNELEPRLVDDLEDIGEWAGKLHGQAMRIAGILHCCINQEDAGAELLTASTMSAAIKIARYFEEHAKAAFRMMGVFEKQEVKDARYIWKRILSTGDGEISKRNLLKLCEGRLKAEDMQPGLDVLESHGYIHTESIRTGGAGRPKVMIKVNPKARRLKNARRPQED